MHYARRLSRSGVRTRVSDDDDAPSSVRVSDDDGDGQSLTDAARIARLQAAITTHLRDDRALQDSIRTLSANAASVDDVRRMLAESGLVDRVERRVRSTLASSSSKGKGKGKKGTSADVSPSRSNVSANGKNGKQASSSMTPVPPSSKPKLGNGNGMKGLKANYRKKTVVRSSSSRGRRADSKSKERVDSGIANDNGMVGASIETLNNDAPITATPNSAKIVHQHHQNEDPDMNLKRQDGTTSITATAKTTAPTTATANIPSEPGMRPGRRHVLITIPRGLAFLNTADVADDPNSLLEVHACIYDQRLVSPSCSSTTEPSFDARWIVELPSNDLSSVLTNGVNSTLRILVIRRRLISGRREIVGSREVEWRDALTGGVLNRVVELRDRLEAVTVGLLEMSIELIPTPESILHPHRPSHHTLPAEEIAVHFRKEQKHVEEMRRLFHVYARRWWTDFLALRPSHADRLVKIFAEDEEGRRLPVTTFVTPIRSRYIESPKIAARIVSLISISRQTPIGAASSSPAAETWFSAFTAFTSSSTTPQSHATLLASLLMGLNLDAYVTLGTNKHNEAVAWVTTMSPVTGVEFWDPTSGARYPFHPESAASIEVIPYRSIGCVFNNTTFHANVAATSHISASTSFDLSNPRHWKPMAPDALAAFSKQQQQHPSSVLQIRRYVPDAGADIDTLESQLEDSLWALLAAHREDHDLSTHRDASLSHILAQCLVDLEHKRITSSNSRAFDGDFLEAVRRGMPEHHVFRGVPVCVNSTDVRALWRLVIAVNRKSDGLLVRGDKVRFGLRVRVFGYVEGCVAVWALVGCRFRPTTLDDNTGF